MGTASSPRQSKGGEPEMVLPPAKALIGAFGGFLATEIAKMSPRLAGTKQK